MHGGDQEAMVVQGGEQDGGIVQFDVQLAVAGLVENREAPGPFDQMLNVGAFVTVKMLDPLTDIVGRHFGLFAASGRVPGGRRLAIQLYRFGMVIDHNLAKDVLKNPALEKAESQT